MRLDLAERLRCPRGHAPTPLVVVATQVIERDLRRGGAGCPTCRYEARFEDGDLYAEGADPSPGATAAQAVGRTTDSGDGDGDGAVARLIALLGLAEAGGAVLLLGEYAHLADPLAAAAGVAAVTDRARTRRAPDDPVAAFIGFGDAVPFAEGTFRGAALGAGSGAALTSAAVRATMRGGRVVAGVALPLPSGTRELARDDREWVAEVTEVASPVVGLSRRGSR